MSRHELFALLLAVVVVGSSQGEDRHFDCESPGKFPLCENCPDYVECKDGDSLDAIFHTCPDNMVFNVTQQDCTHGMKADRFFFEPFMETNSEYMWDPFLSMNATDEMWESYFELNATDEDMDPFAEDSNTTDQELPEPFPEISTKDEEIVEPFSETTSSDQEIESLLEIDGSNQDTLESAPTTLEPFIDTTITSPEIFDPSTEIEVFDPEMLNPSVVTESIEPQIPVIPLEVDSSLLHSINNTEATSIPRVPLDPSLSIFDHLEHVITSSKELCNIIGDINNHSRTTAGSVPLRKALDFLEVFNDIVDVYNKDLERARSDMRVWDSGDSITRTVKRIYRKAKDYENDFDKMLGILKTRLPTTIETSVKLLQIVEQDITELQTSIEEQERIAAVAVPEVRPYIEQEIGRMRNRLSDLENKRKETTPLYVQLKELGEFMRINKLHASDVVNSTQQSVEMIDNLHERVAAASVVFSNYATLGQNALTNLTRQLTELEEERVNGNELKESREKQITQLSKDRDQLMTIQQEKVEEKQSLDNKRASKYNILKEPKRCWYFTYFYHCTEYIYKGQANLPLETRLEAVENEINQLGEKISNASSMIESLRSSIDLQESTIEDRDKKITQIKYGITQFDIIATDAQLLGNGGNIALKDLHLLSQEIHGVEHAYKAIIHDLEDIENLAHSANSENDRESVMTSVMERLESHQQQIDETSQEILNVSECS